MEWISRTAASLLVGMLAIGCWPQQDNTKSESAGQVSTTPAPSEPILPIPVANENDLDAKTVALGEKLFHETRLSADNTIACASCHTLQTGGTDHRPRSTGINNVVADLNAPSVFNTAFQFAQFWDGRADTLEDQLDQHIQAQHELGTTWPALIDTLKTIPDYVAAFAALYPDGITRQNIKNALVTFEQSLSTPNARFDQFLRGDSMAITQEEKEGYRLFKDYGCIQCHKGILLGGNMFQFLGMAGIESDTLTQADLGRFNVTHVERDRHVFKVPGLRNVAVTPPYFHNGTVERLDDAVAVIIRDMLGRDLPEQDLEQMVKFLETLTGEYQRQPLDQTETALVR